MAEMWVGTDFIFTALEKCLQRGKAIGSPVLIEAKQTLWVNVFAQSVKLIRLLPVHFPNLSFALELLGGVNVSKKFIPWGSMQ